MNRFSIQPFMWKRSIDDIFLVWIHGRQLLLDFIDYLNSLHPTIKTGGRLKIHKDLQVTRLLSFIVSSFTTLTSISFFLGLLATVFSSEIVCF